MPRRSAWLPLGLGLVLLSGCTSLEPEPAAPDPAPSVSWRSMPLSWEKLDTLEDYLDSDAARADPASRIEAELELSEGRLTFARRERAQTTAQRTALRLDSAEYGFERVADDPFASSAQRHRAELGLEGVKAERGAAPASGQLAAGGVVKRAAWGALPANPSNLTPHRGAWSRITVHHSADANDVPGIQRYHMRENGWGDIGYHFIVDSNGRIYEGRSLAWRGAHAGGSNNPGNLGVCVLGDYSRKQPGPAALSSLQTLISALAQAHGIPDSRIVPHGDLKATDCPGPYLTSWTHAFHTGARPGSVTPAAAPARAGAVQASLAPDRAARRRSSGGTVR